MNSNSVFLHLLRFFLLGCEKAACIRTICTYRQQSFKKKILHTGTAIDRSIRGYRGDLSKKGPASTSVDGKYLSTGKSTLQKCCVRKRNKKKERKKRKTGKKGKRKRERRERKKKRKKKLVRENSNHRQTGATCQVWVDRRAKWYVLLSLSFAPSVWTFTGIKKS